MCKQTAAERLIIKANSQDHGWSDKQQLTAYQELGVIGMALLEELLVIRDLLNDKKSAANQDYRTEAFQLVNKRRSSLIGRLPKP